MMDGAQAPLLQATLSAPPEEPEDGLRNDISDGDNSPHHDNPSLHRMPGEIKVCIASFLTTEELGALRLTSKHIERQLRHTFTSEFFRKKQFMLTTFSMFNLHLSATQAFNISNSICRPPDPD
jgi:hypothetical protein